MKAFVLAAGLGSRLRPWTLEHPKALVPVGGVPMLERVIVNLRDQGFDRILVNVHHFAGQILDFLDSRDFGVDVSVSDESRLLCDTGGALSHAAWWLACDDEPFLIHNVDILSNARLGILMRSHMESDADATLLVSDRESSRRLLFDNGMSLAGWMNMETGALRPEGADIDVPACSHFAFSGIHAVSARVVRDIVRRGYPESFPIMDYYLSRAGRASAIRGSLCRDLQLIDIGKPESLTRANRLFV